MILAEHHLAMLNASGINLERARIRGYETIEVADRLIELDITKAGRSTPGLLIPQLRINGSTWGYQYRPDEPRCNAKGKPIKYETPVGQRNGIDVPPGVGPLLGIPAIPLWITEGVKKADCGAARGLCIVALPGVWSWRGKNQYGGKVAVGDWNDIALDHRQVILAFDGDVARKPEVRDALSAVGAYVRSKGATVAYLHLPDTDNKTGLDDYLVAGHTVDDLWALVKPVPPPVQVIAAIPPEETPQPPASIVHEPMTLHEAHGVFRKWLGEDYDIDAMDAMLATVAVERFDDGSDPVWLLIISGPGNAKTETVQACDGIGAVVTSSLSSEAALLSATPKRDRARNATGGLLCKIGARGVLVIKDVTSLLSMDRNLRATVMAALREIYDGRWYRDVGTDGGRTIEWTGRIATIGAVTTAWDTAHAVISTMGDRFVLLRVDSTINRQPAGRKAIGNTGEEPLMRCELAAAVGGVIAGMDPDPITISDEETNILLAAADLVTLARTGVEYDYRGDVIDVHAPEMPTRFAKQLAQIVRGSVAIGMERDQALRLAIRCARDSMPPLRLAIIDDLACHPHATTREIRRRLDKPRTTVDRQLQALHMLRVVTVDEEPYANDGRVRWFYSLSDDLNSSSLDPNSVPVLLLTARNGNGKKKVCEDVKNGDTSYIGRDSNITGTPDSNGQVSSSLGEFFNGQHPITCTGCGLELTNADSIARKMCLECHLCRKDHP